MASHMEWSHDFCLSCDRQLPEGGAYCSEACRLADLEKGGVADAQTSGQLSTSASSTSSSNHGFCLPPTVNFSAYKAPSTTRGFDMGLSSPHHCYPTTSASYYAPPVASSSAPRQSQPRSLTPSSSRSSLASTVSQTTSGISVQAATQLNNYVRSFDPVRDLKRRHGQY